MEEGSLSGKSTAPGSELDWWQKPANLLLLAGSSLIVIAIIVLISTSWESFSPTGRIITALIPLVFLYALGWLAEKQPNQKNFSDYTTLTASIIFPFVVGIIVYQSGLYATLDSIFYFLIFLISTVWYLILEFSLKKELHTPLTIMAGCGLCLNFAHTIEAEAYFYSLLCIILGYFFLSAAQITEPQKLTWQTSLYTYSGASLTWYGLLTAPSLYFDGLYSLEAILGYVVVSAIFFGLAVFYSKIWQASKSANALSLRQASEVFSPITLTLPAVLATLSDPQNSVFAILCLLVGLIALVLSTMVQVQQFRYFGGLAFLIGAVVLVFFAFTKLQAGWPIFLLAVGFICMGLAYSYQHYDYRSFIARVFAQPNRSLFGLGINPIKPSLGSARHDLSSTDQDPNKQVLRTLIFGILALYLGMILLSTLFGSLLQF